MMSKPLIAVIEDDESLRVALAGLLRSLGYEASSHASAEAFLESDRVEAVRCIITDIQLPGLSGIGLKQELDTRAVGTAVIMITARVEEVLHARAMASGALCLLKKPFEMDALIGCIDRALSKT
ncbi:MAG: response regulator [Acetobacteraceae bacterium]